jgi:hypothetical protein
MTNQQHLITPPLKMVEQWADMLSSRSDHAVFNLAVQWGADQELEACCEWAKQFNYDDECYEDKLRAARRPKPPSLKEQALEQLDEISTCFRVSHGGPIVCDKIRKALEQLDD